MSLAARITALAQAIGADIKALAAAFLPKTGGTIDGDLNFGGVGRRITGDLSNTTLTNRLLFQTTSPNAPTSVGLIPSGSAASANLNLFGSSDPANASIAQVVNTGGEASFRATATGGGTYLPLTLYTANVERVRLGVDGAFGIGVTAPATRLHVVAENHGNPTTAGTGTTGVTARFQNASAAFDLGTYTSGACFIQPRSADNHAYNFDLLLNPNGGTTRVGRTVAFLSQYNSGNSGVAKTIDFANGQKQMVTLTANCTITLTAPGPGNYQLLLFQDAIGGWSVTWAVPSPGSVLYVGSASAPPIYTTANGWTVVSIYWNGSSAFLAASKVNAA